VAASEKKKDHSQIDNKGNEILLSGSKKDSQFKKGIAEAILQFNETFAQSMQQMSTSMLQIAKRFTQSFEILARATVNNPSQPLYQ